MLRIAIMIQHSPISMEIECGIETGILLNLECKAIPENGKSLNNLTFCTMSLLPATKASVCHSNGSYRARSNIHVSALLHTKSLEYPFFAAFQLSV